MDQKIIPMPQAAFFKSSSSAQPATYHRRRTLALRLHPLSRRFASHTRVITTVRMLNAFIGAAFSSGLPVPYSICRIGIEVEMFSTLVLPVTAVRLD